MLAYFGATLTCLGYIDQGRARLKDALSEARSHGHVCTLAFAPLWAGVVDRAANLAHEVQQHSEELVKLSNEQGFPIWFGLGMLLRGWTLTQLTEAQEGVSMLVEGLSLYRSTGAVLLTPLWLLLLAETHGRLGSPFEGLSCLDEAQQFVEATAEGCNEAEVYRVRGDLLIGKDEGSAAEQNYRIALAISEQQSAKTFELRAATSLARLWRDQGKRAEARDLLAPVYGWFTEGFDTPVLKDAKALLDELV